MDLQKKKLNLKRALLFWFSIDIAAALSLYGSVKKSPKEEFFFLF